MQKEILKQKPENMKKYFFASLLACVGLMSSCSSDSDDQYNLTIGEEISSIVKVGENGMDLKNPESKWNTDTVACYHSETEWKVFCDDYQYPSSDNTKNPLDAVPSVDWSKQTLVFAQHFHSYLVELKDCKVEKQGKKYVVELYYSNKLSSCISAVGAFVVINKPNVSINDITVKSIAIDDTSK